jgi:hypothetical protein
MGIEMGGVPERGALTRVLTEFGLSPTYVLPELAW